jgi:hypothetical protein
MMGCENTKQFLVKCQQHGIMTQRDAALWVMMLTRSCGSLWLHSIREKIYIISTFQEKIPIQNDKCGFY